MKTRQIANLFIFENKWFIYSYNKKWKIVNGNFRDSKTVVSSFYYVKSILFWLEIQIEISMSTIFSSIYEMEILLHKYNNNFRGNDIRTRTVKKRRKKRNIIVGLIGFGTHFDVVFKEESLYLKKDRQVATMTTKRSVASTKVKRFKASLKGTNILNKEIFTVYLLDVELPKSRRGFRSSLRESKV